MQASLIGKAIARAAVVAKCIQIRDYAQDRHKTVDDTPYGGGPGMLIRVDVLHAAWAAIPKPAEGCKRLTVLLSPQGRVLEQQWAKEWSAAWGPGDQLVLVCGHYEGVDERFIELCVDLEVSVGDYVLTGGEIPALTLADVLIRLLPGTVGRESSVTQDSLEGGLLKYPQYTRPREFQGQSVPEILLSGDHGAIEKWRQAQATARTLRKRPDLKPSR